MFHKTENTKSILWKSGLYYPTFPSRQQYNNLLLEPYQRYAPTNSRRSSHDFGDPETPHDRTLHSTIAHQTLMHACAPEHVTRSRYCLRVRCRLVGRRYYVKAKEGGNYRLGDSIAVAAGRSRKNRVPDSWGCAWNRPCQSDGDYHRDALSDKSQELAEYTIHCQTNQFSWIQPAFLKLDV